MLNFIKTNSSDPLKEFELHMRHIPVGIYWPTKEAHEYCVADIKTMYGLDVEVEAITALVDELIALLPPYGMNRDMTRIELSIALSEALRSKRIKE